MQPPEAPGADTPQPQTSGFPNCELKFLLFKVTQFMELLQQLKEIYSKEDTIWN